MIYLLSSGLGEPFRKSRTRNIEDALSDKVGQNLDSKQRQKNI